MDDQVKVLIVEDERLIAENSAIILRNLGYEITNICSSAQAAERAIAVERPDIVLLDIVLKGEIDGIAFAETLRNEHDIPFVYVTATADDTVLARAKLTSPYGYVVKPFNERDLHSNIEMALYKYQTEHKIQHVNEMLYALNEINRLAEDNSNAQEYLEKLCYSLINSPSLVYVWTGLIRGNFELEFMTAEARDPKDKQINPLKSDGSISDCIKEAYHSEEPIIAECSLVGCNDCGLKDRFPDRPLVNARIRFEKHVYGVISAVVLPSMADNPEFLRLFKEVGNKAGVVINALASAKKMGQTKKALARVEERFNRFTELADDLIMVHDLDGRLMYMNPSGCTLTGYPKDEILNKTLDELVAPRSIPEMDERQKSRLRGVTDTFRYETFLMSKSGEEILLDVNSNPILEDGMITSFLLIARDMRERKRQETELGKLSSVVDQSPTAIIITDSEGHITYVNPKFTTMTGYTPSDVIGMQPLILKTDEMAEETIIDIIQTTTQGKVWRGELKTRKSNGEEFWVHVTLSPLRDEFGQYNFIGIIEDISEKREAERNLELSKQSYEDIFNSSSDAIYLQDEDGTFIDVNPGATKMYGQDHDYLVGKSPLDVAAEGRNDLPEIQRLLRRAFEGERVSFEFWGVRKSGEVFPKEVHVNRVNYFGKQVLMATARDITKRKQTELDLKEAAARAEESERVKGYFLANMSHEIRTPLTSIVGYIDLIFARIKSHLSDKDREYFDIIRRNSDRLTRAVHSIIDLSQIEAGATKIEKGSVNLTGLVEMVYNDHRFAAKGKMIKFTYHKPDKTFWMVGDRELLHTAISNLVDNAVSYTDEGQVDVFLREEDGNSCILEIKDTGIGISSHSLNRIFESFSQESMGYTKDYQGLGLGLTLAKKNFELHNIKIGVESTKGEGSSFTVKFPHLIRDEETPEIEETLETAQPVERDVPALDTTKPQETGLRRILVVEDDENAQRLFGLFLKDHYSVLFATTVSDARKVLGEHEVGLILTDLSLVGGESGLDLVEWLRAQTSYDNTPVIALTAHAFVSDRQKCLDAGCNDFITKPIFRAQLLEILEKNLDDVT